MADNQQNDGQNDQIAGQNPVKDPEDWATGDEPLTGPQASYLQTLAQQAGEDLDLTDMTKAQASEHIERLQGATGREGGTGTTSVGGDNDQSQQAGN